MLSGRSVQEMFLQGNQAYEQQDYQGAIAQYGSVNAKGPALWYNLGNSYYRAGDKVQAVICWRRSQINSRRDVWLMAQKNCELIYDLWNIDLYPSVTKRIVLWFDGTLGRVSLLWYQLLFLLLWIITIGGGWTLYKKRYLISVSVLAVLLVCMTGLLAMKYYITEQRVGIVLDKASLHAGPDQTYHVVGESKMGMQVVIKKERNNWYYVYDNLLSGWVSKDACEPV